MSACEKCWSDSRSPYSGGYTELLKKRDAEGHICTPEQQAGPDADECPACHRKTLHQYTGEPMCGCRDVGEQGQPSPAEDGARYLDDAERERIVGGSKEE